MIPLVVCVKIKLAVYKPRSLNVKVLRVTILPGQRADSPPQLVIPPLINGSVTSSLSLLISQQGQGPGSIIRLS